MKLDGQPIETNSAAYINLMKRLERDEEATCMGSPSAPEAVQEVTEIASDQVTALDDYPDECESTLSVYRNFAIQRPADTHQPAAVTVMRRQDL